MAATGRAGGAADAAEAPVVAGAAAGTDEGAGDADRTGAAAAEAIGAPVD